MSERAGELENLFIIKLLRRPTDTAHVCISHKSEAPTAAKGHLIEK